LDHPFYNTAVTEAYPPNVAICQEKLKPLGITVRQVFDDAVLPFEYASFTLFMQTLLLYLYFGYATIRAKKQP